MRLGADLVQRIRAISAIIERIPLVPFQLIVIVACQALAGHASTIIFLRSQGRMWVAACSCIECPMMLVIRGAQRQFRHLITVIHHGLIIRYLRRAKRFPLVGRIRLRRDILPVPDNVSVKTRILGACLACISNLVVGLATGLVRSLIVLHMGIGSHQGILSDLA